MANLAITAANVGLISGPESGDQVAGEAFIAGALVYLNPSDSRWYKAKASGTAVQAGSAGIGMALGTADAAGARVSIARPGAIVSVGGGAAGTVYVVSATAGSLAPVADMVSTNKVTVAALGIGGNQLALAYAYNAGAVTP
jgi:hypothetical protein